MSIDPGNVYVHVLIAVAAVIFGVVSGRAKAARMRELGRDLKAGNLRGFAVVAIVAVAAAWAILT